MYNLGAAETHSPSFPLAPPEVDRIHSLFYSFSQYLVRHDSYPLAKYCAKGWSSELNRQCFRPCGIHGFVGKPRTPKIKCVKNETLSSHTDLGDRKNWVSFSPATCFRLDKRGQAALPSYASVFSSLKEHVLSSSCLPRPLCMLSEDAGVTNFIGLLMIKCVAFRERDR